MGDRGVPWVMGGPWVIGGPWSCHTHRLGVGSSLRCGAGGRGAGMVLPCSGSSAGLAMVEGSAAGLRVEDLQDRGYMGVNGDGVGCTKMGVRCREMGLGSLG